MDRMSLDEIRATIRAIPDYPKPGIIFRDITTLLGDARAFGAVVERLAAPWQASGIERVAGIEARGFILGGAIAVQGAQSPEHLAQAIDRAVRDYAKREAAE